MATRSSPLNLWDVVRRIERRLSTLETGSGMDWAYPAMTNGWINYSPPAYASARYRRLSNGQVEIQGLISGGTMAQSAFTLPPGYRPSAQLLFTCITNNAIGRFDVTAAGLVLIQFGSNLWFPINCTFTPTAG